MSAPLIGHLIVVKKDGQDGTKIPVPRDTQRAFILGKSALADVRVKNANVADEHCAIGFNGYKSTLRNLTKAVTFVNQMALKGQQVILKDKDEIQIEGSTFRWEYMENMATSNTKLGYNSRRSLAFSELNNKTCAAAGDIHSSPSLVNFVSWKTARKSEPAQLLKSSTLITATTTPVPPQRKRSSHLPLFKRKSLSTSVIKRRTSSSVTSTATTPINQRRTPSSSGANSSLSLSKANSSLRKVNKTPLSNHVRLSSALKNPNILRVIRENVGFSVSSPPNAYDGGEVNKVSGTLSPKKSPLAPPQIIVTPALASSSVSSSTTTTTTSGSKNKRVSVAGRKSVTSPRKNVTKSVRLSQGSKTFGAEKKSKPKSDSPKMVHAKRKLNLNETSSVESPKSKSSRKGSKSPREATSGAGETLLSSIVSTKDDEDSYFSLSSPLHLVAASDEEESSSFYEDSVCSPSVLTRRKSCATAATRTSNNRTLVSKSRSRGKSPSPKASLKKRASSITLSTQSAKKSSPRMSTKNTKSNDSTLKSTNGRLSKRSSSAAAGGRTGRASGGNSNNKVRGRHSSFETTLNFWESLESSNEKQRENRRAERGGSVLTPESNTPTRKKLSTGSERKGTGKSNAATNNNDSDDDLATQMNTSRSHSSCSSPARRSGRDRSRASTLSDVSSSTFDLSSPNISFDKFSTSGPNRAVDDDESLYVPKSGRQSLVSKNRRSNVRTPNATLSSPKSESGSPASLVAVATPNETTTFSKRRKSPKSPLVVYNFITTPATDFSEDQKLVPEKSQMFSSSPTPKKSSVRGRLSSTVVESFSSSRRMNSEKDAMDTSLSSICDDKNRLSSTPGSGNRLTRQSTWTAATSKLPFSEGRKSSNSPLVVNNLVTAPTPGAPVVSPLTSSPSFPLDSKENDSPLLKKSSLSVSATAGRGKGLRGSAITKTPSSPIAKSSSSSSSLSSTKRSSKASKNRHSSVSVSANAESSLDESGQDTSFSSVSSPLAATKAVGVGGVPFSAGRKSPNSPLVVYNLVTTQQSSDDVLYESSRKSRRSGSMAVVKKDNVSLNVSKKEDGDVRNVSRSSLTSFSNSEQQDPAKVSPTLVVYNFVTIPSNTSARGKKSPSVAKTSLKKSLSNTKSIQLDDACSSSEKSRISGIRRLTSYLDSLPSSPSTMDTANEEGPSKKGRFSSPSNSASVVAGPSTRGTPPVRLSATKKSPAITSRITTPPQQRRNNNMSSPKPAALNGSRRSLSSSGGSSEKSTPRSVKKTSTTSLKVTPKKSLVILNTTKKSTPQSMKKTPRTSPKNSAKKSSPRSGLKSTPVTVSPESSRRSTTVASKLSPRSASKKVTPKRSSGSPKSSATPQSVVKSAAGSVVKSSKKSSTSEATQRVSKSPSSNTSSVRSSTPASSLKKKSPKVRGSGMKINVSGLMSSNKKKSISPRASSSRKAAPSPRASSSRKVAPSPRSSSSRKSPAFSKKSPKNSKKSAKPSSSSPRTKSSMRKLSLSSGGKTSCTSSSSSPRPSTVKKLLTLNGMSSPANNTTAATKLDFGDDSVLVLNTSRKRKLVDTIDLINGEQSFSEYGNISPRQRLPSTSAAAAVPVPAKLGKFSQSAISSLSSPNLTSSSSVRKSISRGGSSGAGVIGGSVLSPRLSTPYPARAQKSGSRVSFDPKIRTSWNNEGLTASKSSPLGGGRASQKLSRKSSLKTVFENSIVRQGKKLRAAASSIGFSSADSSLNSSGGSVMFSAVAKSFDTSGVHRGKGRGRKKAYTSTPMPSKSILRRGEQLHSILKSSLNKSVSTAATVSGKRSTSSRRRNSFNSSSGVSDDDENQSILFNSNVEFSTSLGDFTSPQITRDVFVSPLEMDDSRRGRKSGQQRSFKLTTDSLSLSMGSSALRRKGDGRQKSAELLASPSTVQNAVVNSTTSSPVGLVATPNEKRKSRTLNGLSSSGSGGSGNRNTIASPASSSKKKSSSLSKSKTSSPTILPKAAEGTSPKRRASSASSPSKSPAVKTGGITKKASSKLSFSPNRTVELQAYKNFLFNRRRSDGGGEGFERNLSGVVDLFTEKDKTHRGGRTPTVSKKGKKLSPPVVVVQKRSPQQSPTVSTTISEGDGDIQPSVTSLVSRGRKKKSASLRLSSVVVSSPVGKRITRARTVVAAASAVVQQKNGSASLTTAKKIGGGKVQRKKTAPLTPPGIAKKKTSSVVKRSSSSTSSESVVQKSPASVVSKRTTRRHVVPQSSLEKETKSVAKKGKATTKSVPRVSQSPVATRGKRTKKQNVVAVGDEQNAFAASPVPKKRARRNAATSSTPVSTTKPSAVKSPPTAAVVKKRQTTGRNVVLNANRRRVTSSSKIDEVLNVVPSTSSSGNASLLKSPVATRRKTRQNATKTTRPSPASAKKSSTKTATKRPNARKTATTTTAVPDPSPVPAKKRKGESVLASRVSSPAAVTPPSTVPRKRKTRRNAVESPSVATGTAAATRTTTFSGGGRKRKPSTATASATAVQLSPSPVVARKGAVGGRGRRQTMAPEALVVPPPPPPSPVLSKRSKSKSVATSAASQMKSKKSDVVVSSGNSAPKKEKKNELTPLVLPSPPARRVLRQTGASKTVATQKQNSPQPRPSSTSVQTKTKTGAKKVVATQKKSSLSSKTKEKASHPKKGPVKRPSLVATKVATQKKSSLSSKTKKKASQPKKGPVKRPSLVVKKRPSIKSPKPKRGGRK